MTADQLASQYRVLVDVLLDAQEHSPTGVAMPGMANNA
jgi:hypothetical protein